MAVPRSLAPIVRTLGFAIPSVVLGIVLLVHYRPTPEYWASWSIAEHIVPIASTFAAAGVVGWWATRDILRTLLIALSSLFLASGSALWANAAFDRSTPRELAFLVRSREAAWIHRSRNSYEERVLVGATAEGRMFRFSEHASHISRGEWERADTSRADYVLVEERAGALGIPWWRIRGLREGTRFSP